MIVNAFCCKGYQITLYTLYTLLSTPAAIYLISGVWTIGKMTCAGGEDLFAMHLAPPTQMCHLNHWRIMVSAFICFESVIFVKSTHSLLAVCSMCALKKAAAYYGLVNGEAMKVAQHCSSCQ